MTTHARLRVVVVALTYRRPDDLAQLLPSLVQQATELDADARVLIVDNDPEGGARAQVAEYGNGVGYLHVARPGIAAARNGALKAAADDDVLVFIDDDERPVADWLRLLVETYLEHGSAAVVGPVISEYATEPDPWISAGAFFTRRRMPTGTRVGLAATNNLLLDLSLVRALGLSFDEKFGLSGGSDTLFTRQLHARGGVMVWCDEAVVIDIVPPSRLTRDWVLRRAFRSGNTWMRTSIELAPTGPRQVATRVSLTAQGLARIVAGAGRASVGAVTGRQDLRARGVRTIARGAGLVAGTFGSVYSEYKR
ncbi:MAG: glycosyltransferase [Burkholderiaceae bacterium]|nr:glycosyltransferase [Microbacteriaceae bacterium]